MARYSKGFRCGEWYLSKRDNSDTWYRTRGTGGKSERISLQTTDEQEAKRRLVAWYAAHGEGPLDRAATLSEVLLGYYEGHGKFIVSADDVRISSRYWLDFFGDVPAPDVSGHEPITRFKGWLKRKGHSDNYVNRVLSVGRAALMRAYERGLIKHPPIVKGIKGAEGPPRGRPLEPHEIRHLLQGPEHLRRFVLLSLATGARPDAVLGLEWEQIGATSIHLNPVGRTQTKKRRAVVPVCPALAELLISWGRSSGPVITFRGRRLRRIKTTWEKARVGLSEGCNPYSLRHTVARWLRSQSVPVWEVAALLGHKMQGHSVTEIYAHADPRHMEATKAALDKLLREYSPNTRQSKPLSMERAMRFELTTLTLAT